MKRSIPAVHLEAAPSYHSRIRSLTVECDLLLPHQLQPRNAIERWYDCPGTHPLPTFYLALKFVAMKAHLLHLPHHRSKHERIHHFPGQATYLGVEAIFCKARWADMQATGKTRCRVLNYRQGIITPMSFQLDKSTVLPVMLSHHSGSGSQGRRSHDGRAITRMSLMSARPSWSAFRTCRRV